MVGEHDIGEAAVLLWQTKTAAASQLSYSMKGRLTFSNSGWVVLEVPNALGNGAFQALNELGIEQPISSSLGRYNAHISVIRPEEVEQIGGPDALKQYRGQMFSYSIGSVREITNPGGWPEVSKVWALEVKSPELLKLRNSFDLGEPKYPFHITFAIRKRNVLRKTAGLFSLYKQAASQTEIKDSGIHGKGLFATVDFNAGDVIVPHLMTRYQDDDGRTRWEQSEQARFTNHSHDPNTFVRVSEAVTELVASKSIKRNEELTADYADVTTTLGPNFRFTYQGKPYGGETDTGDLAEFLESDTVSYSVKKHQNSDDRHAGDSDTESDQRSKQGNAGRCKAAVIRVHADNRTELDSTGVATFLTSNLARSISQRNLGSSLRTKRSDAWRDLQQRQGSGRQDQGNPSQHGDVGRRTRDTESTTGTVGRTVKYAGAEEAIVRGVRSACGTLPDGIFDVWIDLGGPDGGQKARVNAADSVTAEAVEQIRNRLADFTKDTELLDEASGPGKGDWVKVAESLKQQIATARRQTQEPKSEAQAAAGNYPKGRVRMHGFDIVIETGKGQTRSGTDANGKTWSVTMAWDYGDIKRTEGKDGDPIDVFIGPHPDTELVFVIDQLNEKGKFDEHKVMCGFKTQDDAKAGYLANYEAGWEDRIGNITPLTIPQFKWWVNNGPTDKPCAGQKQIKLAMDSYYARALQSTPMNWDQQKGVAQNLLNHLNAVKVRGDRSINETYAFDRLQNAMDPNRANLQLLARIRGTQPAIVNHPVDRIIQGDYSV